MLTKRDLDEVLDKKLKPIQEDVKSIRKDVKKIKGDLDTHIKLTDKWEIHLDNRLRRIENKLDIETPDFATS